MVVSGMRRGWRGVPRALLGAMMVQRGATGRCNVYRALGVRSATTSDRTPLPYELGVRARASVTIAAPREKVFSFWRDLENLPKFMRHLESVEKIDERRTRWVAHGPGDMKVQWEAELINEIPDHLIAWKSLPGSTVASAGSVRFQDAPGGRGTEVRVELQYNPPAGIVGAQVARLFGREPEQEIESDLGRLKQYLESGELATTEGQPIGPKDGQRMGERATRSALEEVIA
jgi:uncharacterized membrane protein